MSAVTGGAGGRTSRQSARAPRFERWAFSLAITLAAAVILRFWYLLAQTMIVGGFPMVVRLNHYGRLDTRLARICRYACFFDLDTWRDYVTAAGFVELDHYYRPPGLPRERQPWLASVWRKA